MYPIREDEAHMRLRNQVGQEETVSGGPSTQSGIKSRCGRTVQLQVRKTLKLVERVESKGGQVWQGTGGATRVITKEGIVSRRVRDRQEWRGGCAKGRKSV